MWCSTAQGCRGPAAADRLYIFAGSSTSAEKCSNSAAERQHSTTAAFADAAPRATAVAAQEATAAPLTGAHCHINIEGNAEGGILQASMDCNGGPVRIGAHPQLLAAFKQSFQGVKMDAIETDPDGSRCAIPLCLIRFCGNTTVSISNSTLTGVSNLRAPELLAVVCLGHNTRMLLRNTSISRNNATAVVTAMQSWLHVSDKTMSANTGYGQPGGVLALDNSTIVVTGGSGITDNMALNASGGVAAAGNSTVIISVGSVISGNTALNAAGGGVAVVGDAVLVLTGASRVVNNTSIGSSGGGVAVLQRGQGHIAGQSVVCNNTSVPNSGGGIVVAEEGQLALVGGSVVCNNTGGGGGRLAVGGESKVTIRNISISSNTAFCSGGGFGVGDNGQVVVFDTNIQNNTSQENSRVGFGGGAVSAIGTAIIQLFNGTRLLGNRAIGLPGGTFALGENASLTLAAGVRLSDNTVVANKSSMLVPYGPDGVAIQASKLDIRAGVLGQGGMLTKCNLSVVLFRRPCGVGEFDGGEAGPCLCCPAFTYSFEPNVTSCRQCPANALCNGDVVSPVAGYRHSSPKSLQIHKCPITGSCQQGGVCSAGHAGNLCGQCSEGFGTTSPLRCGRCMVPRLHMLLVGMTVLFVTTTVHFTWQDNKAGDRSLRPSDLIKVLVQFLQYVVIFGSISVPWPAFLAGVFTAATAVFGVGSGQALSLDCWLPHYVPSKLPLPLQRQLSYFVGAVVVAFACVVLLLLLLLLHLCNRVWRKWIVMPAAGRRQQAPQLHFWSRLRVTLLVTAFFAYPTLVRAALGFFACLRIDDASRQPYPEYSIQDHTRGYWVSAMQQECLAGWHRPWALGFGLPSVLVLCVGVRVGLFVFLMCNKTKTSDAAFCEHYGFLFRNYTNSSPGHGVKLLRRLPCVQKVQASIPARRMVPFFGAMALSLSVLLSGLCPCGASVRGRGFGHFASTKCHPV